jgi:hypothetical protein
MIRATDVSECLARWDTDGKNTREIQIKSQRVFA